jgi:hypothetical protein
MRHLQSPLRGAVVTIAMLTLASASPAQVDGWGQFNNNGPGGPSVTFTSQSTFGVTLGTNALQTGANQGAFWGPATGNLVAQGFFNALRDSSTLRYDLTLQSAQINGGSGNFDGFAQANVIAIQLFHSGGAGTTFPSGGFFPFIQKDFTAGGGTDTSGQNGTWSGVNGTRSITWNLNNFTTTDPTFTDPNAQRTLNQLLTDHPDMQGAAIYFVQQAGNASAPVGQSRFFFDNVRLVDSGGTTLGTIGNFEAVPEPGTLALAALAVPPMVVAIRRRRAAAHKPSPEQPTNP